MFEKCPNCLNRVLKGNKFCPHCGEKMPIVAKGQKRGRNKKFMNVDFGSGKTLFNRYKNYFMKRLKDPTVSMKRSMQKESFQFGLAQLIFIILLNAIIILMLHGKITGGRATSVTIPAISLFVGSLILQGFYLFNTVLSFYVATNYLKKVPTTIRTILSRVGGLASPQLILSLVLFIAVLVDAQAIYLIGVSLSVLVSIGILNFYLLRIKNNSEIPSFYTIILTMGLFLILQMITLTFIMMFSTNAQIYPEIIRLILG